jgi:meiosis induction protein kinase IME2/SME1
LYDGSTKFEASLTESSNPSYANFSSLSVSNLHISDRIQHSHDAHHGGHSQQHLPPKPHVAAYVQQQQQQLGMYEDTPRIGSANQIPAPTPPPIETPRSNVKQPSQSLSPAPPPVPPATLGKKKKWGLSSVFGSSEKHLPVVEESGYQVGLSSSLKRTQSGNHPEARMAPLSMSSPPSAPIEDPKKAKKEAERQARELEKAKREAAERAQKERARAVMRKREQLIEAKKANNSKTELEFGDAGFTRQAEAPTALRVGGQAYMQPPIADVAAMRLQPGSSAHVNPSSSSNQLRSYSNMPGSQSVSSVRSHGSALSGHSQLSASALAARDRMEEGHGGAHRHKARRRDEDDDHSMSSFDVNSLRSRSVLTVGTIDSE